MLRSPVTLRLLEVVEDDDAYGAPQPPEGPSPRRSSFTSGASESNNVGIRGVAEARPASAWPLARSSTRRSCARRRGWRDQRHARDWLSSLTRFAVPHLGHLPVGEVTSADIVETLRPVWHARPSTARRGRQRIGTVMEWAVAMGHRDDNPCDRIGPALGPQGDLVRHMRALPHGEVAGAIERTRTSRAWAGAKLPFEFLVLTAARSGEVRGARWDEMDTEAHVWIVPATRMKMKREHRVPLCRRALDILDAARTLDGGDGALVFPSVSGKRLHDMALSGLLKNQKVAAVPHGFRSSFRDWAAEETDHPREVIEAALAHVVQNKVEAAYARSDLFARRRRLMDDWSAYLAATPRAR